MHNASNVRRYLTEGQTFRAVLASFSAINHLYGLRPGAVTRDCPNSTTSMFVDCPPVQERIWADGVWPPN